VLRRVYPVRLHRQQKDRMSLAVEYPSVWLCNFSAPGGSYFRSLVTHLDPGEMALLFEASTSERCPGLRTILRPINSDFRAQVRVPPTRGHGIMRIEALGVKRGASTADPIRRALVASYTMVSPERRRWMSPPTSILARGEPA
jgi:hypothetical protein